MASGDAEALLAGVLKEHFVAGGTALQTVFAGAAMDAATALWGAGDDPSVVPQSLSARLSAGLLEEVGAAPSSAGLTGRTWGWETLRGLQGPRPLPAPVLKSATFCECIWRMLQIRTTLLPVRSPEKSSPSSGLLRRLLLGLCLSAPRECCARYAKLPFPILQQALFPSFLAVLPQAFSYRACGACCVRCAQACWAVCPERVEPAYLLSLQKAPTQEEFIRGVMSRNPYSTAETGPLMRDVKNFICRSLDMEGLVDDGAPASRAEIPHCQALNQKHPPATTLPAKELLS
jgi:E3 ubiquitin-protein ligase UBR4